MFTKQKILSFFKIFLILLSGLATIKVCFFNLNIDEEYAVTMAYRMVSGDKMFVDMWEPHQTSGFLSAAFIYLYLLLFHTTNYLVLYLRLIGACLQGGISFFLYKTLKPYFSSEVSLIAALFFYNTLPKWIQVPEFANMLTWFSVLSLLCFLRAYHSSKHSTLWFVLAGICISGLVLSYPSCILAIFFYLLVMHKLHPVSFFKDAGIVLGTCFFLGILYISYFLSHMSVSEFLFGLRQMMTDNSHSDSIFQRFFAYGKELINLFPHIFLLLLLGGGLTYLLSKIRRLSNLIPANWYSFCLLVLCCSLIEQGIIWLGYGQYLHYPLVYFYFLYFFGILAYHKKKTSCLPFHHTLFWLGTVSGGSIWFSALLITNTTISVTASYLMNGLIVGILFLLEENDFKETKENKNRTKKTIENKNRTKKYKILTQNPKFFSLPAFTALFLLGITLFCKGFMICENEGRRSNMFFVKQKALYGPAKNIYCSYLDGYIYNTYAESSKDYIIDGDCVLYVGMRSLYYLLDNVTISTFSTISTPSFDKRLIEYWTLFPERFPTIVVLDKGYASDNCKEFLINLLSLEKPIAENEYFIFYRVPQTQLIQSTQLNILSQ